MKRAKPSVVWPKASGLGENFGRMRWRPLRGVSRLPLSDLLPGRTWGFRGALLSANAASKLPYRDIVLVGAPVIGQQMVQHIVNSHRPHKPTVAVDDGERVEVVGRQRAGHLADVGLVRDRLEGLVHEVAQRLRRWEAQQLLDV